MFPLIPGEKICNPCREHVSKYGKDFSELKGIIPKAVDPDFALDNMNEVIDNIFEKYMISPMKKHMWSTVHRRSEAKAKLKRAKQNFDKLNEIILGD